MDKDKPNKYKQCISRGLVLYTVVSLGYLSVIALTVDNPSTAINEFAAKLLADFGIMLGFSLVFGFSLLVFDAKRMSGAAKWTINILIMYAAMISTFFLMASVSDDPRSRVLFILISTILFTIVYGIAALLIYFYKRKRR